MNEVTTGTGYGNEAREPWRFADALTRGLTDAEVIAAAGVTVLAVWSGSVGPGAIVAVSAGVVLRSPRWLVIALLLVAGGCASFGPGVGATWRRTNWVRSRDGSA